MTKKNWVKNDPTPPLSSHCETRVLVEFVSTVREGNLNPYLNMLLIRRRKMMTMTLIQQSMSMIVNNDNDEEVDVKSIL